MQIATKEYLRELDALAARRRAEIRATKDEVSVPGTTYYVSADGCDEADGLSPDTAWQTLARVSRAALCEGDAVRFRRGDVFREPAGNHGRYREHRSRCHSRQHPADWYLHVAGVLA